MSVEEFNEIEQGIKESCTQNAISYLARYIATCIQSIRVCESNETKGYWHNRALVALTILNNDYGYELDEVDEEINNYIIRPCDYQIESKIKCEATLKQGSN